MLGKLFKYDIKATARLFLPLYAVLLIYSAIYRGISLISPENWTTYKVISFIVYIMILVGVCAMTIIVLIQRFYKNLLSDEGYLMFTLPVKPWKHIVSKLVVSMLWTAVSGITAALSMLIAMSDKYFIDTFQQNISDSINKFFSIFGAESILVIIEFLLVFIVSLASNVLIIYASIAVGHLFSRYKILSSLGAYIVISAVSQTIVAIVIVLGSMIPVEGRLPTDPLFHLIMWFMIIFSGLLSAGYFILTNYILSRRLNLE